MGWGGVKNGFLFKKCFTISARENGPTARWNGYDTYQFSIMVNPDAVPWPGPSQGPKLKFASTSLDFEANPDAVTTSARAFRRFTIYDLRTLAACPHELIPEVGELLLGDRDLALGPHLVDLLC